MHIFKRVRPQEGTLIFLHVPKAGGTTLHKILENQYGREFTYSIEGNRVHESIQEFKQLQQPVRERLRVLKGHMPFGLHTYLPHPSTYITILRDPVDRVISTYYFIRRRSEHYAHGAVTSTDMTLEDFVTSGLVKQTDNGQTRLLSGAGSGVDFGDCGPDMLETAKKNLQTFFSVVGVLEKYDETLILLRRAFGWRLPFYIRRNVTAHRPYRQKAPDKVVHLIRERNHLDLQLYQQAKAILDEQLRRQPPSFGREVRIFQFLNRMYKPYGRVKAYARKKCRAVRGE